MIESDSETGFLESVKLELQKWGTFWDFGTKNQNKVLVNFRILYTVAAWIFSRSVVDGFFNILVVPLKA